MSNVAIFRTGYSTFPFPDSHLFKQLQLGFDFFIYGKFNENAPIDELTTPGKRFLGYEPDFFLNWQIVSDVSLAVRYGAFFPDGNAFTSNDVRQFFSTSVTFAF